MEKVTESLMNSGSFWLPRPASDIAQSIDCLFYFILWLSTILFIGILIFGFYFLIKYRRSETNQKPSNQVTHNTLIEVIWTGIPILIVMFIFYWGYTDYLKLSIAPPDSVSIKVVGKKWFWTFNYPEHNVNSLNELVVPVNTPIRLVMNSEDVIHSFFLPNFRAKKDVVPNRYTTIWFESNDLGSYQVFCAEYCGDGHSDMLAVLRVVSQEDYDTWLQSSGGDSDVPLPELGAKLYKSKACNSCHSLDGANSVGSTWKGLYASTRHLVDGGTIKADENYIRESITNPQKDVVKGYAPVMPAYAGLLSDREIDAIIEFIKTQK